MHIGRKIKFPNLGSQSLTPLRDRATWLLFSPCCNGGRGVIIQLAGERWQFACGEPLITEYSIKYSPDAAAALVAQAGWRLRERWHNDQDSVSLHWLEPAD